RGRDPRAAARAAAALPHPHRSRARDDQLGFAMGFLSTIVADAKAHAPVVSATAPAVEPTQAAGAAEGWEAVEMAFSPEAEQAPSSPPPAAPRSAAHGAPGRDDAEAARDPAARAPNVRRGLPVDPSTSSPAPPATAHATMIEAGAPSPPTEPGAPSAPPPRTSPRTPGRARAAPLRPSQADSRQAHGGVPDSRPGSSPGHTRAAVDQRPAATAADDRDGPARETPIAQIKTAAPPGAPTAPASPLAARAAAPALTLQEPI